MLSSIENQTIVSNSTEFKGFECKWIYTCMFNNINIIMINVGAVGLVGNGVALNVIRKGPSIRKNCSYILLFNQSLVDFLSCSYVVFLNAVVPIIPNTSMSGVVDWLICVLVKTHFVVAVTSVLSSYNLAAIALERMACIVYPIPHRRHVTARVQLRVALSLWSTTLVVMLPFTISNNGIDSRGTCHLFDKLRDRAAVAHTLAFETWALLGPLAVIVYSYARIVAKLYSSEVKLKRCCADVLRTMLTVVVVFFSCAVLRTTMNVAKAFGRPFGGHDSTVVMLGYLLRMISFIVNPLIYTLQYKDYRTELRRQAERVCPRLCGIGSVHAMDDEESSS